MPKNRSINGIHAQRLKAIRPFVNFDFDLRHPLTDYQKQKVRAYHTEIDALTARPFVVFRPRRKDHLKTAQQFAQHEKHLPGLKVAFVPNGEKDELHIRFNKAGELSVNTKHVTTHALLFSMAELARDPAKHVKKTIRKDTRAKRFTIMAGRNEIPVSYTRERISAGVEKLAAQYSNTDANNYFGNWLIGLRAHHFQNQDSFMRYMTEKQASKRKPQTDRRNARRRQARKGRN